MFGQTDNYYKKFRWRNHIGLDILSFRLKKHTNNYKRELASKLIERSVHAE